jgi:hypothetical protein
MLELTGQIADLKQNGIQIGGLYDWSERLVLDYTTQDGVKIYKPIKKIEASSYWLLEPVSSNSFQADFYTLVNNDLVLTDSGNVVIDLPDTKTTDRRLYAPIEIRWLNAEH